MEPGIPIQKPVEWPEEGESERLESLDTAIRENLSRGLPFAEWSPQEQARYTWNWTGQACASVIPGNGVDLRPVMGRQEVHLELEDTEEGREISKLIEEMEELDGRY